jgi:ATP-dependent helicase/DNAse subunit B
MPLQVVVGPANAGVAETIRDETLARARDGERVLLLLPSARDVSRVTNDLAHHVVVGVDIRAFDNHLDALWGLLGDGRPIITPVQQLVLLEEAVRSWRPRSGGSLRESRGVVRALRTVVQRAAEVEWTIARVADDRGVGGDLLECATIYERLLRQAGLIERAAAHRLACERLEQVEVPALVAVDGFSSLTRAQERFVVALSGRTDVTIGLVFDERIPATHASADLVQDLASTGELRRVDAPRRRFPDEIAHIGAALAAFGTDPRQAKGAVVLSEAWGAQAESARIVREVQEALIEGSSPGEIAVVFRRAAPHIQQLRTALAEAAIEAEFDAGVPLQSTGLGRALLLVLDLEVAADAYQKLSDVLRSAYGPTPHEVLDELDAHVRRTRETGLRHIESWLRRRHPESAAFVARVRQATRSVGDPRAVQRWYLLTNEMLRRAHSQGSEATPELITDAAAAREFMAAVVSMSGLGESGSGGATLASALREAQVMLSSADRDDRVQVMGVERVRGRHYDCVIIGGLTTGEFPPTTGEGALSAPGVSDVFLRAGIDVAPRNDVSAERLLFYLAATRATRKLVLSWQSHDAEGRPLRPSLFLEEVLDLYRSGGDEAGLPPGLPHHVLRLDAQDEQDGAPRSPRRTLRTQAARAAGPHGLHPAVIEARRRAHTALTPESEAVRRVNAERTVFSASEIETYLQCPYRWYIDRMIRPRELDERFDRSAAGRLAHEIMRRFYDEYVTRSGRPRVTPESLDIAREVHAEVARAALAECGATSTAEVAATRATVNQTLRVVEADAALLPGFVPAYREWSFGAGEDPPEDFGGFSLAGRVDRIDVTRAELVVTDYKLGRAADGRAVAKFAEEGIVQAPLYAAVAGRRLGRRVAGGVYRPIGGGKPRGFIDAAMGAEGFVRTDRRAAADIEALIPEAVSRAEGAGRGIRSGEIAARPRGATCPSYCPARGFCAEWRQGHA